MYYSKRAVSRNILLMAAVILVAFLGFYAGMLAAKRFPFSQAQARYVGVLILVVLDAVFGGLRAEIQDMFDLTIFSTGLLIGSALALWLVYLGDLFGIDLSLAAVVTFGGRIFQNVSIIRRILIEKVRRGR
ncbi:small basic family protein [Coprothermobacteraceae bacterium]|nr:small basic family protein [Coprothermobacteraceae bacterium]